LQREKGTQGRCMEEELGGHGGVVKKIIREGKGDFPSRGSLVTVNYVGRLKATGDVFDESHGYPFKFTLGKGEVIKGWDMAVAKMRPGELAEVTIKSEYGYGKAGSEPDVPPNATLVFEIDLIETKERQQALNPDLARLQEIRRQREEDALERAGEEAEKKQKSEVKAAEDQEAAEKEPPKPAGKGQGRGGGSGGGKGKGRGGKGAKGAPPKPKPAKGRGGAGTK